MDTKTTETSFKDNTVPVAIEVDDNKCNIPNKGNGGGRFRNKSGIHSSYAQLITTAINGADDKRLTLSEIYEWMSKNVPGLYEQRFLHSSKGWKNAVRHTLSINPRFYIIGRLGRPGWWALDMNFPNKSRTMSSMAEVSNEHLSGVETTGKLGFRSGACDMTPKAGQRYVPDKPMSAPCHKSEEFNFDFQVVEVRDIEDEDINRFITVPNPVNVRAKLIKDSATQTDAWMLSGASACPYCSMGNAESSPLYSPGISPFSYDSSLNTFLSIIPDDLKNISLDPSLKCDMFGFINL